MTSVDDFVQKVGRLRTLGPFEFVEAEFVEDQQVEAVKSRSNLALVT